MLEKALWNLFVITGDISIYMYYKSLKDEKEETNISKRVLLDT